MPNTAPINSIPVAMADAEFKAWKSLAAYKFWMFGYHAAQWVMLNRLLRERLPNPFTSLVKLARQQRGGP